MPPIALLCYLHHSASTVCCSVCKVLLCGCCGASSQCDGECGENTGTQSRIVLCYTREGHVTNDSECDGQPKPASIRPCTNNCSLLAVWKSSDWSQVCVCVCVCVRVCVRVVMRVCEHMDPSFLSSCLLQCSAECGSTGNRTRVVTCVIEHEQRDVIALDEACFAPKPATNETCEASCSWTTTEWQQVR